MTSHDIGSILAGRLGHGTLTFLMVSGHSITASLSNIGNGILECTKADGSTVVILLEHVVAVEMPAARPGTV